MKVPQGPAARAPRAPQATELPHASNGVLRARRRCESIGGLHAGRPYASIAEPHARRRCESIGGLRAMTCQNLTAAVAPVKPPTVL